MRRKRVIKKNDEVVVIAGKDKGFKGKILKVLYKKQKVVVDGANLMKKHIKPQNKKEKGMIVEMPAPLDISNILLYCAKCKKGVKVKKIVKEEEKIRICKKCNYEIK